MAFSSFSEFIGMHGKAFYVWGAYGMALAVFILEIVLVRHKRKLTLEKLRMMREAGVEE